jgi:GNAT superfamily N-acetyltransferase
VDTPVAVGRQLGDDRLNPATSLSSRSGGRPIRFFARSRMRSIRLERETPITSATVFIGPSFGGDRGSRRSEELLPHEAEHPAAGLTWPPMSIVYRPARIEDLQRSGELVVCSMNKLCERHGFGPIATVRPPGFSLFSLSDDPNGLWVAEDDGEILGFAFSWVCGDLWFLAQLFVAPDQQGRGIGRIFLIRAPAGPGRAASEQIPAEKQLKRYRGVGLSGAEVQMVEVIRDRLVQRW